MEDFEKAISEILEVDSIESNDYLESFDAWDSLTILSIIAFCDSEYKVSLSADEINKSETIKGLKKLVKSKI